MSTIRAATVSQLPAASTVIDNMASRAKAWALINTNAAPPSFGLSLNCSSISDIGVGHIDVYYTSLFAVADYYLSAASAEGPYLGASCIAFATNFGGILVFALSSGTYSDGYPQMMWLGNLA